MDLDTGFCIGLFKWLRLFFSFFNLLAKESPLNNEFVHCSTSVPPRVSVKKWFIWFDAFRFFCCFFDAECSIWIGVSLCKLSYHVIMSIERVFQLATLWPDLRSQVRNCRVWFTGLCDCMWVSFDARERSICGLATVVGGGGCNGGRRFEVLHDLHNCCCPH